MILVLILIEIAAIPILAEILVRGLPQTLKRASEQNYYRTDGTKSKNRKKREVRATGRLRRDLWAVLIVVFLVADAGLLFLDTQVTSFQTLSELSWSHFDKDSPEQNVPGVREARLEAAQRGRLVTGEQLNRYWPWLNVVLVGGAFACFLVLSGGTFLAYGAFAAGVKSRAVEHARLDMERMRNREWDQAARAKQPNAAAG